MLVKKIKFNFSIVKIANIFIMTLMIITKREFDLIKKSPENREFSLNVDFGNRQVQVKREGEVAIFQGNLSLDLDQTVRDGFCYLLGNEGLIKVAYFDQETNHFYKLVPTFDWPTIAISSVPMHRVASPKQDSENKIKLTKPYGYVLDTCMGLGYTAILASKSAHRVVTFEKDDNVFSIAKINPASQGLFERRNIEVKRADISLAIKEEIEDYYDCIIHDPPTFKLAGELFSKEFYLDLRRVLKDDGKLFHYTPLYKVKSGVDFPAQVKKRLKAAGFKVSDYNESAAGFLCRKKLT